MADPHTENPVPRVSVVVCTYNGARFLRPQLDSLLAQSLPPYEIIVSDDASTDATVGIVREYAARDARVKLHVNRPALGFNLNFSRAFQLAEGDVEHDLGAGARELRAGDPYFGAQEAHGHDEHKYAHLRENRRHIHM